MSDELVAEIDEDESSIEVDMPAIITNVNGDRKRPARTGGLSCQVDLGTGSTRCCVQNCSTNRLNRTRNSQVTFVTFPKDPSRFTEWTRAINRADLLGYVGKKEATDLLVCSRHFSEDMWVNSNTRLKRLHKNAVPEVYPSNTFDDDDFDIIEISSPSIKPTPKRGGLKIRKVSSLLTDSALKESLSSSVPDDQFTVMNVSGFNSMTKSAASARKWPILPRQKNTSGTKVAAGGGTASEKRLMTENTQLKAELDKNMDYILNQKAHYEGLLQKEKSKAEELQSKLTTLEASQKKLWQSYEAQLKAQKALVDDKDGQQDTNVKIRSLQKENNATEKELRSARRKISELTALNVDLENALLDASATRPPTPPPVEPDFTGKNFGEFLKSYVENENRLKEKVACLTEKLERREYPTSQKELMVDLGKRHLNHLQASLLEAMVDINQSSPEAKIRFSELWKALQESSCSSSAVAAVLGTLGIVPPPAMMRNSTASSSINALYDELERTEIRTHRTSHVLKCLNNEIVKREEAPSTPPLPKRRREHGGEDDEREEGRASDEEEELVFSDSEEEESESEAGPAGLLPKHPAPTFDFMLGDVEEINTVGQEEVIGGSMPLLVSDSANVPTPHLGESPRKGVSNRKSRVISSSDSAVNNSGAKVIYRVLES